MGAYKIIEDIDIVYRPCLVDYCGGGQVELEGDGVDWDTEMDMGDKW